MNKQTFQIPDGCKAITMEQVGNQIVTTFEPEFKRGDVLISKKDNDIVCVFNDFKNVDSFTEIVGLLRGDRLTFFNDYCFGYVSHFRLATPEEAQRLWDALAKEGKWWNPETMQVEEIKKDRWRGKLREQYFCISKILGTNISCEDDYYIDRECYKVGNYFRTEEQAERAKSYLQKALDDFWKEELK